MGGATGAAAASASATSGGGSCLPNHDGSIERAEVPLGSGLKATFLSAENVTFDTTGQKQPDGSRAWDLTAKLAGDHLTVIATEPLAGAWYAAQFPGASYAARLSDSQDLLGVFELDADALLLRGVVSLEAGPTQTELSYQPPVRVLAFPFKQGDSWTSTSTVSGQAVGVAALYTEQYDTSVDAHGSVVTPFGAFDALRVRVNMTRTVGLTPSTTVTHLFAVECFGPVATIVSQSDEPGPEFTAVSEIRRLSP